MLARNILYALIFITFNASVCAQEDPSPKPCLDDPAFSAFDFWLGRWDVFMADGTLAGTNRIEKVLDGCLVTESWQGAGGSRGTSINYLDRISNEWVQVWHDAGGGQITLRGGLTDDGMLLTGKIHDIASGKTADFRGLWTLLPDGRVRQFFEQSADDGKTWTTWFEGFYRRQAD